MVICPEDKIIVDTQKDSNILMKDFTYDNDVAQKPGRHITLITLNCG